MALRVNDIVFVKEHSREGKITAINSGASYPYKIKIDGVIEDFFNSGEFTIAQFGGTKAKYRVGDLVRGINRDKDSYKGLYKILRLDADDDKLPFRIKQVHSPFYEMWTHGDWVVPWGEKQVEFKVGDSVKVIKTNNRRCGDTGKVVSYFPDVENGYWQMSVNFPQYGDFKLSEADVVLVVTPTQKAAEPIAPTPFITLERTPVKKAAAPKAKTSADLIKEELEKEQKPLSPSLPTERKEKTMATPAKTIGEKVKSAASKTMSTQVSAGKQAIALEAARILNKKLSGVMKAQLPVFLKGYADTPLGKLVAANILHIGMGVAFPELTDTDPRKMIAQAAVVQAYVELMQTFKAEEMLDTLFKSGELKALTERLGLVEA